MRIEKKAKMPTITPLSNIMIQVLVSRAREQEKKKRERENKKGARERKKLSFAANIIMHIENPKEYTEKPLK